ncbi:MAG: high-potential iron-sulfur protein [Pseudomonadales bacterium]|jgi:hypothetical protein
MTTRRTFIQHLGAAGALTLIPALNVSVARAADKVPEDDPTAKALRYVEDGTKATRTDKMGVKGADQVCDNCRFYGLSEQTDDWGSCQLFQNRLVAGPGWCAGWVPKA